MIRADPTKKKISPTVIKIGSHSDQTWPKINQNPKKKLGFIAKRTNQSVNLPEDMCRTEERNPAQLLKWSRRHQLGADTANLHQIYFQLK